MNSHNDDFALYFKPRDKAILARGENSNYINDYPKDLYLYDYKTKNSSPLISYEWFPARAKYFLEEYDYEVQNPVDFVQENISVLEPDIDSTLYEFYHSLVQINIYKNIEYVKRKIKVKTNSRKNNLRCV